MKSDIEMLDQKRMRYLEWHLVGFVVFIVSSITRHFFRLGGLNDQPIGIAVLIGLILSLLLITVSTVSTAILWRKIKDDPALKEAMNNELIRAIQTQSWKAAYIAAVGTTFFFAITSSFYPVCDLVTVALTSTIVGAGAFQATSYLKYRAS